MAPQPDLAIVRSGDARRGSRAGCSCGSLLEPDFEEVKTMVLNRRLILSAALVPAVLAATAAAYAATMSGPRMGPATTISRKAFEGYYDGHKDTYLSTDVSTKAEAKAMHVNYAPGLKAVPLASAPEMYLVEGKAASGQLAVFGSQPGESSYSPIWKETILTWKSSATPVLITSDTQVDQLEHKGQLTERKTSTRLNCPIVKVGAGG
jgi:hypothetical protein